MRYEDYESSVYYRLFWSEHDDLIHVIEMQVHDEIDYRQERFLRNKGTDSILYFKTEQEAKEFAWDNLKYEHLSDDLKPDCSCQRKNDDFFKD